MICLKRFFCLVIPWVVASVAAFSVQMHPTSIHDFPGSWREIEDNPAEQVHARHATVDNFALLKRELPAASLTWGDPDGDERTMAKRYEVIMNLRREEEVRKWRREREEEQAQLDRNAQKRREAAQLAWVASNQTAFAQGNAEAGLKASYYYTAYALKLMRQGKGREAVQAAQESLEWTRKAAEAGSPRAQSVLGRLLLQGGNGQFLGWGGVRSGMLPKVPKEGPYVSPRALDGLSLPPEFLLGETNGVKTFFRVYRRNPEEGTRYMTLASEKGDFMAKRWVEVRTSQNLPLWMPDWWLEKDGFELKGRTVVSEETVNTRMGPGFHVVVQRQIGYDAEGRVVFVSDERFADPGQAQRYVSPWHATNDTCVVVEVLP